MCHGSGNPQQTGRNISEKVCGCVSVCVISGVKGGNYKDYTQMDLGIGKVRLKSLV